jgi:hypothetical protein
MERGHCPLSCGPQGLPPHIGRDPCLGVYKCGEVYFDEPEVDAIQEVLGALDHQTEKLAKSA